MGDGHRIGLGRPGREAGGPEDPGATLEGIDRVAPRDGRRLLGCEETTGSAWPVAANRREVGMSVRGKMFFLTGAAVGYVFGARAGRKRYDQIVAAMNRIRETPAFQRQVQQAQDYAARKIGELPSVLVRSVTRTRAKQGTSGE